MSHPMNLDQLCRLAMYQAGQVKQSGTAGSIVSTYELHTWANQGNLILENALRRVMDDYFVKIMNSSTDTTAQKLSGINYTPSTSLALAASTHEYTLPPDFISLKSIRAVTTDYEYTRLTQLDLSTDQFQDYLKDTDTHTLGTDLFYDIIGDRTLVVVPYLDSALDIEIRYVADTAQLISYSTGTVAITTGTAALAGTSTYWASRFDQNYLDILYGASGSATLPVAYPDISYDDVSRARVLTVTDNTNIVLATNKNGTLASGTGYILSSLPVIPDEYHGAIADYITANILLRSNSATAKTFMDRFEKVITRINSVASLRQQAGVEVVEDLEFE